jgi:hypothetical protein
VGVTAEAKAAHVIEALSRVMRDLPAIGKDQRASQQQGGYAYRGIEQITAALQPLLAKHGVVFVPKMTEWHPRSEFTINSKPWSDERVEVTYRVYGPGGIEDFIDVGPIPAIGRDNADKGTNKCMTQAFKYALTQVFCIGDSKDDADGQTHERDAAPAQPKPAPKMAIDELRARIELLTQEDPETFDVFAKWKADQDIPWPWPQAAVDAMHDELDRLTAPVPEADVEVDGPPAAGVPEDVLL